jgi:hypothetical protein
MKILRAIPLFAVVWVIYNLIVVAGSGETLQATVFGMDLIKTHWTMNLGELLIVLGLLALFIEIVKSTRTTMSSVLDHSLSTLVFIAFLVEFITVARAGNSVFFILGLMSLMDVLTGFTVTILAARRDLSVAENVHL